MGLRRFTWQNLSKVLQPGGLDRARIALLRSIPKKYLAVPLDVSAEYIRVLNEDRPASLPVSGSGPLRIAWIIPGTGRAIGGLTNIFRMIQHLESWGHECRVYSMGSLPGTPEETRALVSRTYFPVKAEFRNLADGVEDSDVLVASSWLTAYEARRVGNTGRKFYMVQDLEHMFYAPGGLSEMARQTYSMGFYGIAAGGWIADVLRREYGMSCTTFGFCYDREIYSTAGARLLPPGKKRVLFYARPETERRGFELGVLALLLVSRRMPQVEFVLMGFEPHSVKLPFPAVMPGVLSTSELSSLYRSCDVALVLSHTNISLLPLEVMACGCAVVSNTGPNVEWLLGPENTVLAAPDPESLATAMIELLSDEEYRQRMIEAGLKLAASTDWVGESRVIERALLASRESPVYDPA